MNKAGCNAIVMLIAVLLNGCAAGGDTTSASSRQDPTQVTAAGDDSGEQDAAAAALRQELREAIADPSQRDSLHLSVRCVGEGGMRATEVYGNGVGIWNFRQQFTLQPEEVTSLIEILDKADFANFADAYGGRKKPDPKPRKEKFGACCPMQVICSVELSLARGTKQAVQLVKGEQSARLQQLADDLLDACEESGQAGLAAVDLADGLEKVAGGVLAPETFRAQLHRKPEQGTDADDPGFLLQLAGPLATSSRYDTNGRLLDPVTLRLSRDEVASLARDLAKLGLAELPLNLFAPDYNDLSVEVLNHKKSVQARRFAGMTPTTLAENQAEFAQIYDALYELHLRVLSAGDQSRP